jgi:hypothetical protein
MACVAPEAAASAISRFVAAVACRVRS